MFTKQHYEAVARVIASLPATMRETVSDAMADMFVEDNPRFGRTSFAWACGLSSAEVTRSERITPTVPKFTHWEVTMQSRIGAAWKTARIVSAIPIAEHSARNRAITQFAPRGWVITDCQPSPVQEGPARVIDWP